MRRRGRGGPAAGANPVLAGLGRRPGRRQAVGEKHRWCTGVSCAPPPRRDGRIHAHRPEFSPLGRRNGRLPARGVGGRSGVSARGPSGAPRVSSRRRPARRERSLAESSPQIRRSPATPRTGAPTRSPDGGRKGRRTVAGRRAAGFFPRGRFAAQTPGHTRGRRSGRGARARAARASGRTVTQKHRQSTLRSTSGGCLCVTRREDCGRVPSKRRCLGVRIMPIVGRYALRLRILTPHEPRGSRVSSARDIAEGDGHVGLRAARQGSLQGRGRPLGGHVPHRTG